MAADFWLRQGVRLRYPKNCGADLPEDFLVVCPIWHLLLCVQHHPVLHRAYALAFSDSLWWEFQQSCLGFFDPPLALLASAQAAGIALHLVDLGSHLGNVAAFSAYSYLQILAKTQKAAEEAKAEKGFAKQLTGEDEDEQSTSDEEESSEDGGCC